MSASASAKRQADTSESSGGGSAPPGAKRHAADKAVNEMKSVSDKLWKELKESKNYDHFGLMVHASVYEDGKVVPSMSVVRQPGKGVYVCRLPSPPGTLGSATCGACIATSTRNTGVQRHIAECHPDLDVPKLPNPAESGPSDFALTVGVLESGLPYNPFANPKGPLRKSRVVTRFPSAPTVRRHARFIVEHTPVNIKNYLEGTVVHITTDFTPTRDKREMAVVNAHCWKKDDDPCTITLGVIEFEGSAKAEVIVDMLDQVLLTYGIESCRLGGVPHALQLGSCSDSGANAAKASRAMALPRPSPVDTVLPDLNFNGWNACIAHGLNLLIKDAFAHPTVKALVVDIAARIKSVRASRAAMEAIKEQGIKAPGRFVASRWRSMMSLVEYVLRNAEALSKAHDDLAFVAHDLQTLRVVHAVLKPLDIVIAHAQANTVGSPFLLTFRVIKALAGIKEVAGLRAVVINNATETEPLTPHDIGQHLRLWMAFVAERFEERFFSLETADFEDVEQETSSSGDETIEDALADEDDDDEDDDDDDEQAPSENTLGRGNTGRFRRYNILMNSFVLISYAMSPLKSAWMVAVAERAIADNDDTSSIAKEGNTDGLQHLVHMYYTTDKEFAESVDLFKEGRSGASGGPAPRGALALLGTGSRQARDPAIEAREAIERFVTREDVRAVFAKYLAKYEAGWPSLDDDNSLVAEWESLTKQEQLPPFVGRLLRIALSAPMTSTKCESDFSLLQHLLDSRRLRMSRVMLAAYMFCKKARRFVPTALEPRRNITAAGTRDIGEMLKFKSHVAGPLKPLGRGAAAAASGSGSSSRADVDVASVSSESESDDDVEEPELVRTVVTTRSGRVAGTVRAADVARRVIVSAVAPPSAASGSSAASRQRGRGVAAV